MSIFDRFFKSGSRTKHGIDVTGVSIIPTKCPTCGQVGDFQYDITKHDFFGVVEIDKDTHFHVLECPYCMAGMLLCIRKGRLMGIEPFKDDQPADMLAAVGRARKKLGI